MGAVAFPFSVLWFVIRVNDDVMTIMLTREKRRILVILNVLQKKMFSHKTDIGTKPNTKAAFSTRPLENVCGKDFGASLDSCES